MTIVFRTQWGAYSPGQRADLGSTEEARLIALGLADDYSQAAQDARETPAGELQVLTAGQYASPASMPAGVLYMTAAGAVVVRRAGEAVWSPVSGDGGPVASTDITDSTEAGRAMLTATNAAAQWALLRAQSLADYEVATFADLPAANTVTPGRVYTVLGNITGSAGGSFGTRWASNGTVWRPAGGQVLWHLTAQADGVAGGTTSEQILASPLFPARVFAGCRAIVLRSRWTASAADANLRTLRWRLGAAGNAADPEVSAWTAWAAAGRVALMPAHLSPAGNTALQPIYFGSLAVSPDAMLGSNTAPIAPVSVPDMSASALYVSASVQQGGSPSSTVSLARAWIYVE